MIRSTLATFTKQTIGRVLRRTSTKQRWITLVGRYQADGTTLHPARRKARHRKPAARKRRLAANLSRPTGSFG